MADFVIRRWRLDPYPGDQAPPHVHQRSDEAFCVLSGQLAVLSGETRHVLGAGEHLVVPAGTRHTFATVGDTPVELLCVMTEEIDELITALHEATDDEARSTVWARYNSALA